ncbi:MAG: FG-GAP-like repeat-containing protein, partial [Planctomycetota bacterium]
MINTMIFRENRTRLLPALGAFTAAALIAQDASAQSILYTKQGAANDRLGASVASAGDHNNDTAPDFVIGIPENFIIFTAGEGRATVYSGANGSEIRSYLGDNLFDEFGASVSGAGDVNNDGTDDVIVGAPFVDNSGNLGAGMARVFSGTNGSPLYTFFGLETGDQFGDSVSGAGDVNNDGFDDVIVGAEFHDNMGASDTGMARVYSGANGSVLYTVFGSSANDLLGIAVSDAGDVNNDGFDDFIIGSANAGARVYSGQNGAVLHTFTAASNDQYGRAVASAGDVNNDGNDDVIIGAPQDAALSPGNGYAEVRSGADGSILHSFMGSSVNDRFGVSVAGARDLNNDGFDDVIVGADQSINGDGYIRAFSGQDGSLLLNYTENNPSTNIRLGTSVDGLGDVDSSGSLEVIVGAPLDSAAAVGAGTARVISVGGGPVCPPPTNFISQRCVAIIRNPEMEVAWTLTFSSLNFMRW